MQQVFEPRPVEGQHTTPGHGYNMNAHFGSFLPVAILSSPDRLVIGESGHRNFDEKPRAYEFASGCLGSFPDIHEWPLSAEAV